MTGGMDCCCGVARGRVGNPPLRLRRLTKLDASLLAAQECRYGRVLEIALGQRGEGAFEQDAIAGLLDEGFGDIKIAKM